MRIITGKARGVKLDTLEGLETRPTADRVKEAVFSIIQFEIEGKRVLDLFAGSGQMGLETVSRGAKSATEVDSSKEAAGIIRKNAIKTKLFNDVRIINEDYKAAIKTLKGDKFDIVFCDAPYAAKLTEDAVKRLLRADILSEGAVIICESDEEKPFELPELTIRKHNKYGRVFITIYDMKTEENDGENI